MSLREFESLSYPYTIDALLNYTIVDKDLDNVYENKIEEFDNKLTISNNNLEYTKNNNHYEFYVDSEKTLDILLDKPTDQVLIITFDMNYQEKCSVGNPSITINETTNTLSCKTWKYHNRNETFHYVISSDEDIDKLNIKITKGHYDISNIKIYEYDYNNLKNITYSHDNLNITNISDKEIGGNIEVTKVDSYFQISIPYDKGFQVYVDDIKIDYEKINTSFIGFKLDKGSHNIVIKYNAPLSKIGNIISLTTLIGITIYYSYQFIYRKKLLKN